MNCNIKDYTTSGAEKTPPFAPFPGKNSQSPRLIPDSGA
jgi:hypothetical protein